MKAYIDLKAIRADTMKRQDWASRLADDEITALLCDNGRCAEEILALRGEQRKRLVDQHQRKDWAAGRKWVCKCSECQAVRKQEKERDRLLVPGVDYEVVT